MPASKAIRIFARAFFLILTSSAVLGEGKAMDTTKRLLDKIDELTAGRVLSTAGIAKSLGTMLQPDGEQSNEFMLIYGGEADSGHLFDKMELRLPGPESTNPSQLLDLTVNSMSCVSMNEIIRRYGEGELSVPTPRQPVESPIYLAFSKPWGKLSFGFARDTNSCLRTILIFVKSATAK